jgi:hypothetical protein
VTEETNVQQQAATSEVVPAQYAVHVWINEKGDAVISRDAHEWESTDDGRVYVVIPRLYVPRTIERLRELFAEGG